MPGGVAVPRQRDPLHEAVAPPPERSRSAWDLLGRLNDAVDLLALPVLSTVTSLVPRRIGSMIRSNGNPHREADPLG